MKIRYILLLTMILLFTRATKPKQIVAEELVGTWVLVDSERLDTNGNRTNRLTTAVSVDTVKAHLERLQGECYNGSKIAFKADGSFSTLASEACTPYNTATFNQGGTFRVSPAGDGILFTLRTPFFVKAFPDAVVTELTPSTLTLNYNFFNTLDRKTYVITDRFVKE